MASYSMAGPTTSTPPVLRSFSQRSKSRSGCTEPICTWATFKTLVTWTMKSWLVHDMILISRLILIHNWVGFHPLYTAKNQGYGISWNGLARDSTKKHFLCWKGMNTAIFVASHPKGRNRKLLRMGGWISWKEVQKHPRIQIMILCIYIYIYETPSSNNFSWIWTRPSWSFLWQQKHVFLCMTIDNWHLPLQGSHISKPSHPWRNPNGHSHAVVCAGSGAIHQSNVANKKCINRMDWTVTNTPWGSEIWVFFQCSGRFQIIPKLWRWK